MNFGKWFGVVVCWLGCGLVAHAQFGVYFGYTGTRLSGIQCLNFAGATNDCSTNGDSAPTSAKTDSVNPSGVYFGGYYDFRNVGPVRLGVDARYIDARSNKSAASSTGGPDATTANTVLGGLRGTFHTPISWVRPYAEIAVGRTASNATEPSCQTTVGATLLCSGTVTTASPRQSDNFLQFEGFVGVDIHVFPILDLRPVELGIGNMNRFGSGATPGTTSSVGVMSISAGIVLHMPPH